MMAAAVAEPPVGNVVQGSVRLWRVSGDTPKPLGEPVRVDDNAPAKSVAFHPSNKHLAVGTDDGTVHIWDISTAGQPANPVPAVGAARAIGQLAFSPDGTTLAAGGADNLVYLWSTIDPRSPRPDGPPIGGSATYINAVAFSPDGATLAIASSDANNGVRLLDLVSRHIVATMAHPTAVTAVKFSPDSTQVITGANDGTARIWPVLSSALESMDYTVSAARFSPNGDTLAIGSADLRLLDVSDPQYPRPLGPAIPNPDGFSGTLAFAPNNRLLAEGRGRSGTAQIWNIANPSQLIPLGQPLKAHSKQIETLAFSPDSTILATGSRDGAVHLWDVRTPETPVRLSTPGNFGGFVHEVAFSPDGTLLVAGSADKNHPAVGYQQSTYSDSRRPAAHTGQPLRLLDGLQSRRHDARRQPRRQHHPALRRYRTRPPNAFGCTTSWPRRLCPRGLIRLGRQHSRRYCWRRDRLYLEPTRPGHADPTRQSHARRRSYVPRELSAAYSPARSWRRPEEGVDLDHGH